MILTTQETARIDETLAYLCTLADVKKLYGNDAAAIKRASGGWRWEFEQALAEGVSLDARLRRIVFKIREQL